MFGERLSELKEAGLLRNLLDRAGPQGPRIIIQGRTLINFASNDYLGLASNAILKEASIKAISEYGTGAGASRLLGGGTELHRLLEKKIALFKGTEEGLILNSGYTANVSCIPSTTGPGDFIFSDELNHASIIDGCRLSRAKVFIYRHKDTGHLEELLFNVKDSRATKLIITDSVFSMDGDIAPLRELVRIAESYGALLYIDDAHATGVLGDGHGSLRHFGLSHKPFIIQMGTFSKALGSFGAYMAVNEPLRQWFINSARGFIYSTALPPSVVAASLKALDIIENDRELIKRLWQNRERVLNLFKSLELRIGPSETPIIPLLFEDIQECLRFSSGLYELGIYAPAIRPPTVKIPRIRFTVTAAHTEEDIEALEKAIKKLQGFQRISGSKG